MSTLKLNNLEAATGTTINIASGDKISGAAGSLSIPGVVVQMQNPTLSGGANTTTSTSFVDTGLTVNITPKFATSKIFVSGIQAVQITVSTNGRVDYRCVENGSSTEVNRLDYIGHDGNAVTNFQKQLCWKWCFPMFKYKSINF